MNALLEQLLSLWGIAAESPEEISPGVTIFVILGAGTLIPAVILCFAISWNLLRTSRRYAIVTTCVAVAIHLALSVRIYFSPLPSSLASLESLAFAVFTILWFWHVSSLDIFRALFVSLSCASMMAVCVFAGQVVNTIALGQWQWLSGLDWVNMGTVYGLAVIGVAVLWKPARIRMPHLLHSPVITPAAWRGMWLAPFGLYVMLMMYHMLYMDVLHDHSAQLGVVAAAMYCMLLMLLYWLLYRVDEESVRRIAAEETSRQLALSRVQLQSLHDRIRAARHTRHDLRQHIVALRAYINESDMDGLRRYLTSLENTTGMREPIAVCENTVMNAVLSYYLAIARRSGVEPDVRLSLPEELSQDVADLTVIVGNLMENAVGAVDEMMHMRDRRPPLFRIRARVDGEGALFFAVDNSFVGTPKRNDIGQWMSSKHGGVGLGLQSVESVVDRLGGTLRIDVGEGSPERDETTAGVFRVSVMLPAANTEGIR